MATRTKKAVITENITLVEAGEYMASYAIAASELEALNADMDLKIHKIRDDYKDRIDKLTAEKQAAFEMLEHFAETNEELFKKKKSVELPHGTVGYRTGMPKLSPRKGFQWKGILELVKEKMPSFIRKKEEIDKDLLLAKRNEDHIIEGLKCCGMEVVQDESFYVESKAEVLA